MGDGKDPNAAQAALAAVSPMPGDERGGTARVPTSWATGAELRNIQRCLTHRPAKPDNTALAAALSASAAAVTIIIRSAAKDGAFTLDVWGLLLLGIAAVAAYAQLRKYLDARYARDVHLEDALADVNRLMAATAEARADVEAALLKRLTEMSAQKDQELQEAFQKFNERSQPAPKD